MQGHRIILPLYCLYSGTHLKKFYPIIGLYHALISIREGLIKFRNSLFSKPLKDYKKFMPASYKMVKEGCKATLQGTAKDIKAVEKQLQELIKSDEQIKQQYPIATLIKGIGPVTACQVILCSGSLQK